MLTPIGLFRTSKITYAKPQVVTTPPLIDISTWFQILTIFSTMSNPIGLFKNLKNDFWKTGSSYNFAYDWYFYPISNPSHLFDHVHSNRPFQDFENDCWKTGSSYNFAINCHFRLISNPNHLLDHSHSNRIFQDFQNDFRKTGSSYNLTLIGIYAWFQFTSTFSTIASQTGLFMWWH